MKKKIKIKENKRKQKEIEEKISKIYFIICAYFVENNNNKVSVEFSQCR